MNTESAREGAFIRRESFKKKYTFNYNRFWILFLKKITHTCRTKIKNCFTHTQSRPFVTSLISYFTFKHIHILILMLIH